MTQTDLPLSAPEHRSRMPSEPIVRAADISDCGLYRWTAKRAWGAGPRILWCCFNPSRADAYRDDPTMLRMMGFSYRWGFGSMVVVNVFPYITAHPIELRRWQKNRNVQQWMAKNFGVVTREIDASDKLVAAWGNVAQRDINDFLWAISSTITGNGEGSIRFYDWQCIGWTKDGSPTHPLARGKHRVQDDAVLQPWKGSRL